MRVHLEAAQAVEMFCYQVKKGIGALATRSREP